MALRVGLCIPNGKKSRIRLPERIKDLCQQANIKLIEIDINRSLELQGPFDVLLHKVLDYHNEYDSDEAEEKVNKLMTYASQYQQMTVLDNFEWSLRLTDRKIMGDLIKACEFTLNDIKVFYPSTVEIKHKLNYSELKLLITDNDIKFPVLVKSYSAYFNNGAHEMSIAFNLDHLLNVSTPCLVQEFCNHGGILYKVFVVGNKYNFCERPSIKDVEEMDKRATIHFDTQMISKLGKPFYKEIHSSDPNKRHWYCCDEKPNLLDRLVVHELISRIQRVTGLMLFGLDILIEKGTGNYAVIDINQFPSYGGIGERHFPNNLVDLLKCFF